MELDGKTENNKRESRESFLYKLHSTIIHDKDSSGNEIHMIEMVTITPDNRDPDDPNSGTNLSCIEEKKYSWLDRKWIWKIMIKSGNGLDPNVTMKEIVIDNEKYLRFSFRCKLENTGRGAARFLPYVSEIYGYIPAPHDGTIHFPGGS